MEQDQHQLIENLEPQKFEQVGEISKCKECGKEKKKHVLTLNCPELELKSTKTKKCFNCKKPIIRQYVFARKRYSQKNDWYY